MSRYPWLEQNQSKEQKRMASEIKKLEKQLYILGGPPPDVLDTGYGENGALNPSMPTHLLQTNQGPRTIHEGERLLRGQDGSFQVIPASQMGGQQALSALEQEKGIRGYQHGYPVDMGGRSNKSGRSATPTTGGQSVTYDPKTKSTKGSMSQIAIASPVVGSYAPTPTMKIDPPSSFALEQPGPGKVADAQATSILPQPPTTFNLEQPGPGKVADAIATPKPLPLSDNEKARRIAEGMKAKGMRNDEIAAFLNRSGYTRQADGTYSYTGQQDAAGPTYERTEQADAVVGTDEGYKAPPTVSFDQQDTNEPEIPAHSPEDIARQTGLGILALYAAGDTPQDRKIREQERSRFANEAAAARNALEQRLAQSGITGQEAMTERALLDAQLNAKENELMGQLRVKQAERTFEAVKELAKQGLAGQQLSENARQFNENMGYLKEKYGDEIGSRMAADAASGMSWQTFSLQYPDATKEDWENMRQGWSLGIEAMELKNLADTIGIEAGRLQNVANLIEKHGYTLEQVNNLDLDGDGAPDFNFTTDQFNSISALRHIRVEAGKLDNAAKQLGIDISTALTAADLFARGMSAADVNERLKTSFTDTDRDDILAASTYGMWKEEFDFKRQAAEMDHAYNLLKIGGDANIRSAAEILNDNLPGANVDFRELITAENVDQFNQGMQQISQLIASNVDWRTMLKNDMDGAKNLAKLMGMPTDNASWPYTANKIGAIYQAVDANYIDLQWQTIEESEWFQRQPAHAQQDITDTFDAVISGELHTEWTDTGKFEAYGDDGKYIGLYDSKAEAQKAAGEFGKVEAERQLNFKDANGNLVSVNVGNNDTGVAVDDNFQFTGMSKEEYDKLGINDRFEIYRESVPEGEPVMGFNEWKIDMPATYDATLSGSKEGGAGTDYGSIANRTSGSVFDANGNLAEGLQEGDLKALADGIKADDPDALRFMPKMLPEGRQHLKGISVKDDLVGQGNLQRGAQGYLNGPKNIVANIPGTKNPYYGPWFVDAKGKFIQFADGVWLVEDVDTSWGKSNTATAPYALYTLKNPSTGETVKLYGSRDGRNTR